MTKMNDGGKGRGIDPAGHGGRVALAAMAEAKREAYAMADAMVAQAFREADEAAAVAVAQLAAVAWIPGMEKGSDDSQYRQN